jgi:hypothetical protein
LSVSRGDRIGGAIGTLVWGFAMILLVLAPISIGWKILFGVLYLAGLLNFVLQFLGRSSRFDVFARLFGGSRRSDDDTQKPDDLAGSL